MYTLLLILTASLFISVFTTNWPIKLYHRWFLKKLARRLGVTPSTYGLFAAVASQLTLEQSGRRIQVRFLEGTMGALYANSGLEIRITTADNPVVEFYRRHTRKDEWGDFRRILSGDAAVDEGWLILTPEMERARAFLQAHAGLVRQLSSPYIDQILVNNGEIIIQLRRIYSVGRLQAVLEELADLF